MRQRVCLIGDHHQLPPVVKNLALQKYGQTRSTACRCTHTRALTHPWPRKPPRGSPRGAEELRLLRAPTLRSSRRLPSPQVLPPRPDALHALRPPRRAARAARHAGARAARDRSPVSAFSALSPLSCDPCSTRETLARGKHRPLCGTTAKYRLWRLRLPLTSMVATARARGVNCSGTLGATAGSSATCPPSPQRPR